VAFRGRGKRLVRRLHRILLNICSTFMALAFIVLLVFVPLGYYREYDIIWGGQHRCASVWTSWGRVWMNVGRTQGEFPSDVVEKGWVFGSQANQPADPSRCRGSVSS
jgi:hypothetical protein